MSGGAPPHLVGAVYPRFLYASRAMRSTTTLPATRVGGSLAFGPEMSAHLSLLDVVARSVPPDAWADGDNIPWSDPAFSARMLREHLSQEHDLASRRTEIVSRHVEWLHGEVLGGQPGRILDLGCGPGLYLHGLARRGHVCTGVDFGPASIEHARAIAAAEGLPCAFRLEDLRRADLGQGFDLITMIYGQLNVFRRTEAAELLRRARAALSPGGRLVVELQTMESLRADGRPSSDWTAAREGLFSERPHLVLHERFWDERNRCSIERWYVVNAATGEVSRHALTNEAYAPDEISATLGASGFERVELLPSLPGTPADSGMLAVVASVAGERPGRPTTGGCGPVRVA